MAIADTITSMQNNTSNAYTMIGYGTDLTGINKNLANLSSTIKEAFLESLRNPNTLFTNLPKKSGSGANITLNDTANAPMRITLGSSELTQASTPSPSSPQEVHTISGSNTIKVEGKNIGENNIESQTKGSLTITRNNDGTLYISGTDTGTQYISASTNNITLEAGTYVLSGCPSGGSASTYDLYLEGISGTNDFGSGKSFTLTQKTTTRYTFRVRANTSTNITVKPMIEIGSSPSTYTPYISQEQEVDLGYENILNPEDVAKNTQRGITFSPSYDENGNLEFINVNGTSTEAISYYYINDNITLPAGTYYLSDGVGSSGGENNNTFFLYTSLGGGQNSYTSNGIFTLSQSTTGHVRLVIRSGITMNNVKIKPMISRIEKAPFIPYGSTPIDYCKIGNYEDSFIRNSGKNLFNAKNISISSTDYSLNIIDQYIKITTSSSNNSFDLCGGIRTGTYLPNYADANDYHLTKADKGTYKLSISNVSSSITGSANQLLYIYTNQKSIMALINSSGVLAGTTSFTLEDNEYVKSIYIWTNGSTSISKLDFNLQLEKGSQATTYEPYGNGDWYIKKNIGKVVLDGSESWGERTNSGNVKQFYVSSGSNALISATQKCNYFPNYNGSLWNWGGVGTFAILDNSKQFVAGVSNDLTLEDFKTSLGTTNLEVYYILATPTYTKITGTLANQLENVYQKLLSYENQTNISQINNDLSFNMSIQAIEK